MTKHDIIDPALLVTVVGGNTPTGPGYQDPQAICGNNGVDSSTQAGASGRARGPLGFPIPFNIGFQQVRCNPPQATPPATPQPQPPPQAQT